MRTTHSFLLGGALLVAFAVASFLYVAFVPDRGDTPRGVLFFGSTLYPTLMGLVLLVAGFTAGLSSRTAWNPPRAA